MGGLSGWPVDRLAGWMDGWMTEWLAGPHPVLLLVAKWGQNENKWDLYINAYAGCEG